MPNLPHILLADEDDQYAFILQLALRKAGIESPVHRVTNRDQVIDYMDGAGRYADRVYYPLPATIILALRLPLQDDFKALRWVRQRPEFNNIHIIVLSGMECDDERGIAQELGADCYKVKPLDFRGLVHIAQRLRERWLKAGEQQAAA
jgi:DNA-binding response OmpR family regulator